MDKIIKELERLGFIPADTSGLRYKLLAEHLKTYQSFFITAEFTPENRLYLTVCFEVLKEKKYKQYNIPIKSVLISDESMALKHPQNTISSILKDIIDSITWDLKSTMCNLDRMLEGVALPPMNNYKGSE